MMTSTCGPYYLGGSAIGFFLFAYLAFAFPSALPSLFLLPLGWEGAGGGVSQELGKGYSMDNCSG
jgi:hypothetical protein